MSRNNDLWNSGVRIIHYPNGHRVELRPYSDGSVREVPIETEEEKKIRRVNILHQRISEALSELEELGEPFNGLPNVQ